MYRFDSFDGWDWLWMSVMMGFWVVLLGLVIYIAVRIAQGDRGGSPKA